MDLNLLGENKEYEVSLAETNTESVPEDSQEEMETGPSMSERLTLMTNSVFRKIVRQLIYVAAFLVPLWFLPFSADGLEFDKQVLLIAIAGAGLILFLLDVIKSGILKYKRNSFYWPLSAIVLASIVSVIFSVNRFASLFGESLRRSSSLISWIAFALLFFLALNTTDDKGKKLSNILTFSLVITLLFAALQSLGLFLFRGALAKVDFNTVGSLDTVVVLAAICLPLFLAQTGSDVNSKFYKIVGYSKYLGVLLSLFFLVLVNWWVAWAVAFVSVTVLIALGSSSINEGGGRMKRFAVPMAIIVLGIFLMLVNFNISGIKSKFPVEVSPTYATSFGIIRKALVVRPLGFGLENFPIVYDKLKPADIANTVFYQIRFDNATSAFLNLAAEGGILMVLAFLSLLWFYGREFILRIKNGVRGDKNYNAVWAASLGLLLAFFLYPINVTLMVLFIFLLVFLGLVPHNGSAYDGTEGEDGYRVLDLESNAKYSFLGSLSFVVGLVAVLVAAYFTVNNYIANVYLGRALSTTDQNQSLNLLVKSANSNSKDTRTYRYISQLLVIKLGDDLKKGANKDENQEQYNARIQNEIASAVNIAMQATTINAVDSQNWRNLAFVYQNLVGLVGGADQAAISADQEALKRNPADPEAYLQMGTVYLAVAQGLQSLINNPPANQAGTLNPDTIKTQISDNLSKAEDNFKKAIALYDNYGQALYDLASVYDQEGKLPEAIKQFEKLQAANPSDPSIVFQLGLLYYRNNQKDNALKAWQQAVVLFPNYSNARWYLSLIYEERGDLANALAQVEAIQKLNPDDTTVQQRLTQLQAGKRAIPPAKVLDQKPLQK